ncbi:MAG: DUF3416 domain-containing protein, partial [Chloroflexota bacterium]|nr:DUF3416 domain-containing protein [Chloroflexota bacterium]
MTPVIENVYPEIDCGRFPVKRVVGDTLDVWADIFGEGHGVLASKLRWRRAGASDWHESDMAHFDNDRWRGAFPLREVGRYVYTVQAYHDAFESWRQDLIKRKDAGEELAAELLEGQRLAADATGRASAPDEEKLRELLRRLQTSPSDTARLELLLVDATAALIRRHADRGSATKYRHELEVVVDREKARFSAWYE